jgi:hypothetical protein
MGKVNIESSKQPEQDPNRIRTKPYMWTIVREPQKLKEWLVVFPIGIGHKVMVLLGGQS